MFVLGFSLGRRHRPEKRDQRRDLRFRDCSLDTDRRELRRGCNLVAIEPQVFDLLLFLIRNRTRVVSKDDLIAEVWNGRIVSESALYSRITNARHAIGDTGEAQRLIRTFARKGLRFVGEVRERPQPGDAGAELPAAPRESMPQAEAPGSPERRQLTIMACNMVGATALAAHLDPEDFREVVASLSRMCARGDRAPWRLRRQIPGGRSRRLFRLSASSRGRRRAGGSCGPCGHRRRSRFEDRRYRRRSAGTHGHRDRRRRGWRCCRYRRGSGPHGPRPSPAPCRTIARPRRSRRGPGRGTYAPPSRQHVRLPRARPSRNRGAGRNPGASTKSSARA